MVISVVSSPASCRSEVTFPAYGCGSRSPSSHADPAGAEDVGAGHRDAELGQHGMDLVLAAGPQVHQLVPLCRGPDYAEAGRGGLGTGGGRGENLGIIRGLSAQLLKECEQVVGRAVAARADAGRSGPVEGSLFESSGRRGCRSGPFPSRSWPSQSAITVMSYPACSNAHGRGVPQHMRRNGLACERRACRLRGSGVPGDEQLDRVAAEGLAAAGGEERVARPAADARPARPAAPGPPVW